MALKQTSAARHLLYEPGDMLRSQLALGAAGLREVLGRISESQLQAFTAGRASQSDVYRPEGIQVRVFDMLDRLAADTGSAGSKASAADRAMFLAILGDIGTTYTDVSMLSKAKSELDPKFALYMLRNAGAMLSTLKNGRVSMSSNKKDLKKALSAAIEGAGLAAPSAKDVNRVKREFESVVVGPAKKQELQRQGPALRSGVHDVGAQADDAIGVPIGQRIPAFGWGVATIAKERVRESTEPLMGHISGSPAETLMVWETLIGMAPDQLVTKALDDHRGRVAAGTAGANPLQGMGDAERDARLARLAGTCAMLIGVGYHSAVEVAEGALKYMGQDLRGELSKGRDAVDVLGHGAATDVVSELMDRQRARPPSAA